MSEFFHHFSAKISQIAGSPWAFIVAVMVIISWILTGPVFGFSDTWQLAINTGTNVVTLLIVFLIQNTQNRDAKAIHLKLDELLKGTRGARTGMIDAEDLPDNELEQLQREFQEIHEKYSSELTKRKKI